MIPELVYTRNTHPAALTSHVDEEDSIPWGHRKPYVQYIAVTTHPDIAFAVSALSQFLNNPGIAHWEGVKKIFNYLSGTKTLQLTYDSKQQGLEGYTDADGVTQEHHQAMSALLISTEGT